MATILEARSSSREESASQACTHPKAYTCMSAHHAGTKKAWPNQAIYTPTVTRAPTTGRRLLAATDTSVTSTQALFDSQSWLIARLDTGERFLAKFSSVVLQGNKQLLEVAPFYVSSLTISTRESTQKTAGKASFFTAGLPTKPTNCVLCVAPSLPSFDIGVNFGKLPLLGSVFIRSLLLCQVLGHTKTVTPRSLKLTQPPLAHTSVCKCRPPRYY